MISVFFGKDDFSAHEALAALISELDVDGMLADNTVDVEGPKTSPDVLLSFCQTVPFLGNHRLVTVRGLLGRFETAGRRTRRKNQEPALGVWKGFVEALPDLPPSTTLVFLDRKLRAQNPLLRALRAVAQVREFQPLRQSEVAGWIKRRTNQVGVTLEGRAIAVLAGLVGNNLWTLDSELQKLATYAGGRSVTEEDVRAQVSLAREPNVFAMVDAMIEGRVQDATDLLQRLLDDGEPSQRLLMMIERQYRLLLLSKELLEQRVRPQEISARLQVKDFVIQRIQEQAPAYDMDRLHQAHRRLLEADLSVKRGVYDDQTALQLLVFELAMMARPRGRGRATRPGGRQGYGRPPSDRTPAPSGAATPHSGTR